MSEDKESEDDFDPHRCVIPIDMVGKIAAMDTKMATLEKNQETIQKDVKDILAWINRSKGGLHTLMTVIAVIGGAAGAFFTKLFGGK